MEVYPERQKRQKTRFVCDFKGKSVFRCTQRAITQRRVITLGPIFIEMVLNRAQGLKEKSQEVSERKNNNRQRYNKKCRRGGGFRPPPPPPPPPALLGLNKKKLISKISVDSNFEFTSYAWLCCVSLLHRLQYWINCRWRWFTWKLLSSFNTKMILAFGEMCFLEENYK